MSAPIKISRKNLPFRVPYLTVIVLWLLLDRLNVPSVWMGVYFTLAGVWVLLTFALYVYSKPVDIERVLQTEARHKQIDLLKTGDTPNLSRWRKRLDDAIKAQEQARKERGNG